MLHCINQPGQRGFEIGEKGATHDQIVENTAKLIKANGSPSVRIVFLFSKKEFRWTVLDRANKNLRVCFVSDRLTSLRLNHTKIEEFGGLKVSADGNVR